jgi:class 3 adenylate cyclase/tetratricopeptide (TPR) repeat protein
MAGCTACGFEYEGSFKFCPDCASPLPAAAALRESRKTVTALFCDLVGSTALGEQHDPEVLRPMFERYFTEMRSAVERHGGRVEKFIGDAVAAVFGLPSAHEDDALRAIRAGFEMQASLEALNAASPFPLAARVGISTGEVLVSGDGNPMGDVMNTAARLQTAASPGSVLIGDPTRRLVRDAIVAEAVEPLDAKGKAEPVPAWRVVQIEAGTRRQSTTPFVGRGRLIASLGVVFDEAVADGAPVLATVLGDPGIGKSRLLDAFLRDRSGTTVLRTSVPAAGEGSSLAPVADLVRAAVGTDAPDEVAYKLASLVRNSPDARALEAALRALLGLGGQSPAESTWAIRRLLETLAAQGPVIAVLDDLQWASPALIDLVEDAARWTRGPVLLLCAARLDLLDARRSWGGGMQRAITITVGPLEANESHALADALVGSNLLETDRLVATAEGNPLFLEQLAVEARELGDAWDPSAAPTTIRALLEARLDRCSPDVTSALELASVQGSRFRVDLLGALAPEGLDLGDVLRQADRAHLAREVEPNVGAFAHALVRETAYHRLPKATRADLHAAIAELFPEEEEEELAAIHLEQAATLRAELGRPDIELERRAGELLARTGARAFSRLDFMTASDLLERAAALLPHSSAVRLEMLPDFAIALMEAGRADDAALLLEEALVQADQVGSRRDAIRIRLQQLALYAFTGPSEDEIRLGISEGRALLAELTDLDDDVGLAQGWTVIEYLHVYIGEMADHAEAQARSFLHAERAGRLREQVQAGGDQPCATIRGPCTAEAMKAQAESMRQSPNPIISTGGIALVAAAAALVGDVPAYRSAESEWRLAIEAGGLEWSGADQALAGLALVLLLTDAPETDASEAAESMARQGLDVMERLGDVWVVNDWGWLVPLALAKQGRMDEASVLADALAEQYTPMGAEGRIYRGVALSIARRSRGRPEEALTLANEAASTARSTDSNLLRALALEHLADLQCETDPPAAIGTLQEVAGIHAASGNTVGAERVARILAALS